MKKLLLILLVLRVAAPLGLAGYMWMRNRGKDVSLNFDKIVRGDITYTPYATPPATLLYTVTLC